MTNALLGYPEYPVTFWSFKYALELIHRKAAFPPLGLLTVASLLPSHWKLKLVDLNIEQLTEKHLVWADYVMISAMNMQRESTLSVIDRCKQHAKRSLAEGLSLHQNLLTSAKSVFCIGELSGSRVQ
jgi:hypothetical protein